jgi:uncharacterized coiled-coil protein SlyX
VQVLEDKEEEMKDLADKMEALAQDLAERESEMAADAEEVEALTADLKNVRPSSTSLRSSLMYDTHVAGRTDISCRGRRRGEGCQDSRT